MGRSMFTFLAISNVVVALALGAVCVSLNKTVEKVTDKTVSTLIGMNDQHTDFVKHMLGFIANQTMSSTGVGFFAVAWLILNAAVSWWYFLRRFRADGAKASTAPG